MAFTTTKKTKIMTDKSKNKDKDHTRKEENQQEEGNQSEKDSFFTSKQIKEDSKRAIYGGGLAAVFTLLGGWVVGEAAGGEAHMLLNMALGTTRTFCSTVTLALGNILALMLALLGLSAGANVDLKWTFYKRVKQISWVVSITLIGSVLIYLLLNIPLEKSENASNDSFAYFYYITLALSSILGGAIITIVLMLYNTVKDVIHVLGPDESDDHLNSGLIRS